MTPTEPVADPDLIATVTFDTGEIDVRTDDSHERADYSSGPWVNLALTTEVDGVSLALTAIDLDEEQAIALIGALTKALEIERGRALKRGYYEWIESGQPDHVAQPSHPFFQEER